MESFLADLRAAHPGEFETARFMLGPLKGWDRIQAKVETEYGGNASKIADIVRGTFISDNADDLPRIQDALEERFEVVRVKDNVFTPTKTGLRNYNNNIVMPNGHIVETQVMPAQLWAVKAKSHDLMEEMQDLERQYPDKKTRPLDITERIDALNRENRILQNAAVYETGLNDHLSPDFTHRERAQFNVPFEAAREFNASADPLTHVSYNFNRAASPFLQGAKKLGLIALGSLPIVGLLADTAEAQELDGKVQAAITRGEISEGALLEYHTILAGKIAAGFDPSVLGGDIGVQAAFNDWAERNHVQGELREALQPSSLALMMRDGAGYIVENADRIPESIADVSVFTAQQGLNGVEYAAGAVWGAADGAYDSLSGNTAEMQTIYDSLPVLSYNAQGALENGAGPIRDYPSAHALAEIKTSLVRTQQMIDGINEGTRPPVSGMNAEESTAFLSERMARLHQSFEDHFAQAQADGTLSEVSDYLSGHGGTAQADAPSDTMDFPVRSFALAGGTAMRM